jgi:hypothetical protein
MEHVRLHRISTSLVTDKKKLFDLLTKIRDRGNKNRDTETIQYTEVSILAYH